MLHLSHFCFCFLELMEVQQVPHITIEEDNSMKTALIPFCEFGGDMSVMGVMIDHFDVPVCNSFRPKIVRDQLCYQVNPNDYKDKIDSKFPSLSLYIHYNEDRQMEDSKTLQVPSVTLQTISMHFLFMYNMHIFIYFHNAGHLKLYPDNLEYNFNIVKEIIAKDSILTLDESVRKCQEKPADDCENEKFINALTSTCQCLPFQLRFLVKKVSIKNELFTM